VLEGLKSLIKSCTIFLVRTKFHHDQERKKMKKRILDCWFLVILFVLSTQGCSAGLAPIQETPTATSTLTPSATATITLTPSRTPKPTRTPNAAKTQAYEDLFVYVQKFKDEGLIPSTEGKYMPLVGFEGEFAQVGWLRPFPSDYYMKHFIYKGHIEWSTALTTNETSGCGIAFAGQWTQDKSDYFGVILDKSRIFFSFLQGGYYWDLGKTRGTGRLNFSNPAEAELVLLAYDYKAFVYVDDEFIGEYTLPKKKDMEGYFGYAIISGTNRDYGTKCKITNSRIWKIE
jgi:hypothetical protein